MKKLFSTILLLTFSILSAHAQEPDSVDRDDGILHKYFPVEGLNQWQYTYDISDLEEGVYNLVVRGVDEAGNIREAEPVDIRVDPESDLPVATVTYPSEGMRVTGDMSLLGSAVDDDGIDFVEIRIDDGEYTRAQGGDYWSLKLSTEDFEDGEYTITVRATDTEGVQGKEKSLKFFIDRSLPDIRVISHENGSLVSKAITLEGVVADANGIRDFHYSLDGRETFSAVRLKENRETGENTFSFKVNTRELEEGPRVIWLKSDDMQGSTGRTAVLLFVDNSSPEIDIFYPGESDVVNGRFPIIGRVSDRVGVSSLTYMYRGDEPVEIPLQPGNPFWAVDADFRGERQAELVFTVTDLVGNTTEMNFKYPLDTEADKPTIQLLNPAPGDTTTVGRLQGWVLDDDVPSGLVYRIDREEDVSVESGLAFDIPLQGLNPGRHSLSLYPQDEGGVEGEPLDVEFILLPAPPEVIVESVINDDGTATPFRAGMILDPLTAAGLQGTVRFFGGSGMLAYFLPGDISGEIGLKKTDTAGVYSFELVFPGPEPFGYVPLRLKAADTLGPETEAVAAFWMHNHSVNNAEHGLYSASGDVDLSKGATLDLRYIGYPLESVELVNGKDFLELRSGGDFISISPTVAGEAEAVRVVGTSDRGTVFLSPEVNVRADLAPPSIRITEGDSGAYTGFVNVEGVVKDDLGPVDVVYRTRPGTEQPVTVRDESSELRFSGGVDISTFPPEGKTVEFLVRDAFGKESSVFRSFQKITPVTEDSSVKVALLFPEKDGTVFTTRFRDGQLYIAAGVSGLEKAAAFSYSIDGGVPKQLQGFPVGEASIPMPDPGVHTLEVWVEYGEDKSTSASHRFTLVDVPGSVALETVSGGPMNGEQFRSGMDIAASPDTLVRGIVSGGRSPEAVRISLDDGEPRGVKLTPVERGSAFEISLEGLAPGRHDLKVESTDVHGFVDTLRTFFFILLPEGNHRVTDNEGIYPLDSRSFLFHGRELERVELEGVDGAFSASFSDNIISITSVETAVVEHALLRAVTSDGDEFEYGPFSLSSDADPPEINLVSPENGMYFRDTIPLEGIVKDNLKIEKLEYSFDGVSFSEMAQSPDGVLDTVPLGGIEDGPFRLILRATDVSGNMSEIERFLVKDTRPPKITQILPLPDEEVNGMTSLHLMVEDEWAEAFSGSFSINGEELHTLEGTGHFEVPLDLAPYTELPESMTVTLTDSAGNTVTMTPSLQFNPEGDRPEVQIQIPEENSLVQDDAVFSGMVFDDDGVERVEYSLDGGEFVPVEGENSFEIALSLSDVTDNEHTIDVRAFDPGGVESTTVSRTFRVSRDVPDAALLSPALENTNKGMVRLSGTASDANGISAVSVSIDNGNSFQKATGAEEWHYMLDSRVLVDGSYMILIKAVDSYGVEAIYTSLITVDNTPPVVELSSPADGFSITDTLMLQARITDAVKVKDLSYTIQPLDIAEDSTEKASLAGELQLREVVLEQIDVSSLPAGRYGFLLKAADDAENEVIASRNFIRKDTTEKSVPQLIFPLSGDTVHGPFVLEGRIDGDVIPPSVTLVYNGDPFDVVIPRENGYFSRKILPGEVEDGRLEFSAVIRYSDGIERQSSILEVFYRAEGPWITFESLQTGSYVRERPWVEGLTGYFSPVEGGDALSQEEEKGREIKMLEFSLDNGRSFTPFKAQEQWKFRLETQNFPDGEMDIIVRATFKNGESAHARLYVTLDDSLPQLTVVTPEEGMAFNGSLPLSGTAFDENGLSEVSVMLREGSKDAYEIPEFVQGLYIDGHFLGATYWEVGLGLTFFDDNVKIQALLGQAPSGRFNGMVFGVKLLANVATLPYGYFFGPDWDWLSSSVVVGSAFEYFTMTESTSDQAGLVLGALVAQVEIVKMKFPGMKFFNTYSIYVEDQLWFISSDIQGGLENRIAFGVRVNVF